MITKHETYNQMRYWFRKISTQGIVCMFDNLEDFMKWSYENGYQYGYKLYRINEKLGWSPENCVWIDHQKRNEQDLKKMAAQWNEFIAPIRLRYAAQLSEIFGTDIEGQAARETKKREVFRYEHPDLEREGISWGES